MANLKAIDREELLKALVEQKDRSLEAINRAFVDSVAKIETLVSAGKEVEVRGLEDLCSRSRNAEVFDLEATDGYLDIRYQGGFRGNGISEHIELPEGHWRIFLFVMARKAK